MPRRKRSDTYSGSESDAGAPPSKKGRDSSNIDTIGTPTFDKINKAKQRKVGGERSTARKKRGRSRSESSEGSTTLLRKDATRKKKKSKASQESDEEGEFPAEPRVTTSTAPSQTRSEVLASSNRINERENIRDENATRVLQTNRQRGTTQSRPNSRIGARVVMTGVQNNVPVPPYQPRQTSSSSSSFKPVEEETLSLSSSHDVDLEHSVDFNAIPWRKDCMVLIFICFPLFMMSLAFIQEFVSSVHPHTATRVPGPPSGPCSSIPGFSHICGSNSLDFERQVRERARRRISARLVEDTHIVTHMIDRLETAEAFLDAKAEELAAWESLNRELSNSNDDVEKLKILKGVETAPEELRHTLEKFRLQPIRTVETKENNVKAQDRRVDQIVDQVSLLLEKLHDDVEEASEWFKSQKNDLDSRSTIRARRIETLIEKSKRVHESATPVENTDGNIDVGVELPSLSLVDLNMSITEAMRKFAADKIGVRDLAQPARKLTVVRDNQLTSPTYMKECDAYTNDTQDGAFVPALFESGIRFLCNIAFSTVSPEIVFKPTFPVRTCWPFRGGSGNLTIFFDTPAVVSGFALEQNKLELLPLHEPSTSPKRIELVGINVRTGFEGRIADLEYDINGDSIQHVIYRDSATEYDGVRLVFLTNHGSEYTCVHRIRIL
mmetsp:Transcript_14032/g.24855  ORF Transcript_14032/g.24855 Transcript_14032/m.24855 type:complete len:666 (-) Transcript_14032:4381-6378(-)